MSFLLLFMYVIQQNWRREQNILPGSKGGGNEKNGAGTGAEGQWGEMA
jgi:hypothetical protein